MVLSRVISTKGMTARILRAACILGFVGVVWAADNSVPPAANTAIQSQQPPATTVPVQPHSGKQAQSPKLQRRVQPGKLSKPLWSDLSPAQQQALAPLSADWDKLDDFRKQKWLVIANKFQSMKPEEQQRMQNRMRDWVKLTPAQRRAAREAYARTKKLNADQKSTKWQQYQSLPEEEKKKLAAEAEAKRKKRLTHLPRAIATKNKTSIPARAATKPSTSIPAQGKPVGTPSAIPQITTPPSQPVPGPSSSPTK
jgi:hypothetical protein